jgi:hypothetical protein
MDIWFSIFSFFKKSIKQNSCTNFIDFISKFEVNGITGKIKFDENGLRTDVSFEVVDLAADGVQKVGRKTKRYSFGGKFVL